MRPDFTRLPHDVPGGDPHAPLPESRRAVRIGIGGPVGSGKTALVAALCRSLAGDLQVAVVTNDIYTTEDADFLRSTGVLTAERIAVCGQQPVWTATMRSSGRTALRRRKSASSVV